jgi:hypothetical protein
MTPSGRHAFQAGRRRSPARLSHIHLFFVGWTYYLAVPILAGKLGLFDAVNGFEMMSQYCTPADPWWPALIAFALLLPGAFVLGTALADAIPRARGFRTPIEWPTYVLLPLYAVALAVTTIQGRASLFAGYAEGVDISVAGPIATVQLALLLQYLAAKCAGLRSARALGLLLAAASIVLIGMGGRLYVLSALVALYVRWWMYGTSDPRARRRSLLLVVVVPVLFGIAGMWRLGIFDPSLMAFYLFAEPTFTSISAFTLMDGHSWKFLDTPTDLISAFVNIVPSPLWPEKTSFLMPLDESPLRFESPFGAISIVTSAIGNFGYPGGIAFVGFVGFVMERVRRATDTSAGRALYCYLCGLLPFMFFRDPFHVQVKVVITGFLLIWVNRLLAVPFARHDASSRQSHELTIQSRGTT